MKSLILYVILGFLIGLASSLAVSSLFGRILISVLVFFTMLSIFLFESMKEKDHEI